MLDVDKLLSMIHIHLELHPLPTLKNDDSDYCLKMPRKWWPSHHANAMLFEFDEVCKISFSDTCLIFAHSRFRGRLVHYTN